MAIPSHPSYHGKNTLITGGLGFIGSTLAGALLRDGASVTIVDCRMAGSGANAANLREIEEEVRLVATDIGNGDRLKPLLAKADVIFNLAGVNNHREAQRRPETDLAANVTSQLAFLTSCAESGTKAPIVFTGTRTEYGPGTGAATTEDHPLRPVDIHGAHKVLAETYHALFHRMHGLRTVTARIVNTYGPRQPLLPRGIGLLASFLAAAIEDKTIEIFGGRDRIREIVFVDDAVEALLRLGETPGVEGESFNVGGFPAPIGDIAAAIVQAAGKGSVEVKPFPDDVRTLDVGDVRLDCSKIARLCGWKPSVAPSAGLSETVQFFRTHYSEYLRP